MSAKMINFYAMIDLYVGNEESICVIFDINWCQRGGAPHTPYNTYLYSNAKLVNNTYYYHHKYTSSRFRTRTQTNPPPKR